MRRLGLAVLLAGGCRPPAPPPTPTAPTVQTVDVVTSEPEPALPPGVLARAPGEAGIVQVEERDGLRLLTIDGVVQGAARLDGSEPVLDARDPLVQLVRAARPQARSVLLVGLGTGQTASALQRAGFEVLTVEREATVVEFARRYFGFEGEVVTGEGLAFLQQESAAVDVVMLDAFARTHTPQQLMEALDIEAVQARLSDPGGLLAIRLYGAPQQLRDASRRLDRLFTDLYGGGVSSEAQTLYLLHSRQPMSLVGTDALPAWPLASDSPLGTQQATDTPDIREVTLAGYLIVERSSGALALDLPHYEMGARRYVLEGKTVAELRGHLADGQGFPTQGDISTDGDVRPTARSLLGGGGYKRSDVRFSSVAIAVRGRARVLATVHPDAMFVEQGGDMSRWRSPEPRLPYGGVLYGLEVEEVLAVIDKKAWDRLRRGPLAPLRRAVTKAARAGRPATFVQQLRNYLEALDTAWPRASELLPARQELQVLLDAAVGPTSTADDASTFDVGIWCDELATRGRPDHYGAPNNPDAAQFLEALEDCAIRRLERARRNGHPRADEAVERLLVLYQRRLYDREHPAKTARRLEKTIEALERAAGTEDN